MTAKVHLWEVNCPECLSRLNAVPASKPNAAEVIRPTRLEPMVIGKRVKTVAYGIKATSDYVAAAESYMDFLEAALSRAAAYRKEKERG